MMQEFFSGERLTLERVNEIVRALNKLEQQLNERLVVVESKVQAAAVPGGKRALAVHGLPVGQKDQE